MKPRLFVAQINKMLLIKIYIIKRLSQSE